MKTIHVFNKLFCCPEKHIPDVSDQLDEFVADEVGGELGDVAEHSTHSKQCGGPLQVLQMPVQKCEDESIAKTHEPGHEEHRAIADTTQQPDQVLIKSRDRVYVSWDKQYKCPSTRCSAIRQRSVVQNQPRWSIINSGQY